MKYLCLILGFLLIVSALSAWIFYGKIGNDWGGGYVFVGIAGGLLAGWGITIHEKEMEKKG